MKKIEVDKNEIEPLKDIIKFTSGGWTQLLSMSNGDLEKDFREQEVPEKDRPQPKTPTIDFCTDERFSAEDKLEARCASRSCTG